GSADDAEALDEIGIARTTIFCPLSHPAACRLANRFPNQAEIDWDDETEERVGSILPFLIGLAVDKKIVKRALGSLSSPDLAHVETGLRQALGLP
ncbi:MAG: hypothetical protein HY766_16250, partial [candidate division NC10 bacterium]|nr:hypothetical protein [candidate division NC10 bacterium]